LPTPPPVGFQPGIDWDGNTGHITVSTPGQEPKRDEINKVLDTAPFLNSDEIEVDWSSKPRVSIHHDDTGQVRQVWYKLPLRKRNDYAEDVEYILDMIYDDIQIPKVESTAWRTIQIGDTHIAKSAIDGAGSAMLVRRWKESVLNALSLGPAK